MRTENSFPEPEALTRREFLKRAGWSVGGITLTSVLPNINAAEQRVNDVEALPVQSPELTTVLRNLGIEIDVPDNWPVTYAETAEALHDPRSRNPMQERNLVADIEPIHNNDGEVVGRVWRGRYKGEMFPLRSGISYNHELGYHVDSRGNPVFDPAEIFDYTQGIEPDELVDLELQKEGIAVFARRGGATQSGDLPHSHYYFGTEGAGVDGIEQLAVVPPEPEVCPTDPDQAGVTKSYRLAAAELRDNPHTWDDGRDVVSVNWYDPETRHFRKLDGRMIEALTREGTDLSMLERMPAGYPLSPEEVAGRLGGDADKYTVNTDTFEWFYESFRLQPGVYYEPGVGHRNRQGDLLIGPRANQADRATSEVFNFDILDYGSLLSHVEAPEELPAVLFARAGRAVNHLSVKDHSWYTWGSGDVHLLRRAIEQMTLMPVDLDSCPEDELPRVLESRAKQLAEAADPTLTRLYWTRDGSFEEAN